MRFQGVEDKEESRPKSSPAGKTRKEESSDDKLPSAVSSPIGKAEPKQLFNPVGKGEGSAESKRSDTLRTPARSMSAPSTRAFQYATPGYTGSPTKSAGRRRLEYVLENIHARKKVSKYMTGKMKTFKNALSTGQVTEHQRWTYTEDGVKVEATPPFSMELQHHTVSDYRSFRPTSANKRLMPSKDRDPSQFLQAREDRGSALLRREEAPQHNATRWPRPRQKWRSATTRGMTRCTVPTMDSKRDYMPSTRLKWMSYAYFEGYTPSSSSATC